MLLQHFTIINDSMRIGVNTKIKEALSPKVKQYPGRYKNLRYSPPVATVISKQKSLWDNMYDFYENKIVYKFNVTTKDITKYAGTRSNHNKYPGCIMHVFKNLQKKGFHQSHGYPWWWEEYPFDNAHQEQGSRIFLR